MGKKTAYGHDLDSQTSTWDVKAWEKAQQKKHSEIEALAVPGKLKIFRNFQMWKFFEAFCECKKKGVIFPKPTTKNLQKCEIQIRIFHFLQRFFADSNFQHFLEFL